MKIIIAYFCEAFFIFAFIIAIKWLCESYKETKEREKRLEQYIRKYKK